MPSTNRDDPLLANQFLVEIDGVTVADFAECSGIGIEVTVVEYRNGNERPNSPRKLPGLVKYSNIVLRRGYTQNADLWNWFKTVLDGRTERRSGAIIVLNEAREQAARWVFHEAWICKYEGPLFDACGTDVAIETIELAVEGLVLEPHD